MIVEVVPFPEDHPAALILALKYLQVALGLRIFILENPKFISFRDTVVKIFTSFGQILQVCTRNFFNYAILRNFVSDISAADLFPGYHPSKSPHSVIRVGLLLV